MTDRVSKPKARFDRDGLSESTARMDAASQLKPPRLRVPRSIWIAIDQHWTGTHVHLDGVPLTEEQRGQLIQVVATLNRQSRAVLADKSDPYLCGVASAALARNGLVHGATEAPLDLVRCADGYDGERAAREEMIRISEEQSTKKRK